MIVSIRKPMGSKIIATNSIIVTIVMAVRTLENTDITNVALVLAFDQRQPRYRRRHHESDGHYCQSCSR